MNPRILLMLALATMIACWSVQAQTEKKPLTNKDVLQMVKAGLAEGVVVKAIESNPAAFDLSPTGLIELQKEGVTEGIQTAMLATQKPQPSTLPASVPGVIPAGLDPNLQIAAVAGSLNRVFVLQGTERAEMNQNKGEYDSVVAPFFTKIFLKFEGKLAEFRITSPTPVFEITLPGNWVAAEHVKLVKPEVKKQRRELTVQGSAGFGVPIKPDKKANVGLTFEEVKTPEASAAQFKVFQAKPVVPLSPGEYLLSVDHAFYCFGVDRAK